MRAQAQISIEVISVSRFATDVISRDEQLVEAVMGRHRRVKVLKELKLLTRHANI